MFVCYLLIGRLAVIHRNGKYLDLVRLGFQYLWRAIAETRLSTMVANTCRIGRFGIFFR